MPDLYIPKKLPAAPHPLAMASPTVATQPVLARTVRGLRRDHPWPRTRATRFVLFEIKTVTVLFKSAAEGCWPPRRVKMLAFISTRSCQRFACGLLQKRPTPAPPGLTSRAPRRRSVPPDKPGGSRAGMRTSVSPSNKSSAARDWDFRAIDNHAVECDRAQVNKRVVAGAFHW